MCGHSCDMLKPNKHVGQWWRWQTKKPKSQVWLHFSKLSAENAFFNIFIAECKSGYGNTSNLKKTLVKPKIQLRAECTGFEAKFIDMLFSSIDQAIVNKHVMSDSMSETLTFNSNR